jgi:Protein of unknown function (DUF3108)
MMNWFRNFLFALLLSVFFLMSLVLTTPVFAFSIPERLEFDISYAGIPAGHAVQEVSRTGNEITIVSTARSADWLKFFFPVDDRIESVLLPGSSSQKIGVPRLYRERIKEGRTRRHKEAVFDRKKLEVVTKDYLNPSETTKSITPLTYDTLSSFYYFRMVPLKVGNSYYIDIFDCKTLWNTEVKVLRREEIETPLGKFKTVVIKPILKSEGIFARSGDMYIWLTDDEQRIPVLMKSKVKVGSIAATLVGGSYWPKKK